MIKLTQAGCWGGFCGHVAFVLPLWTNLSCKGQYEHTHKDSTVMQRFLHICLAFFF